VPAPAQDSAIRDELGRRLVLHGANFMAVESHGSPVDYRRMRGWGFNVVRILMTWAALEPQPGVYDPNYLPAVVEPQVAYANDGVLPPSTEIFINADDRYPEGFRVRCTDREGTWAHAYHRGSKVLSVTCDPGTPEHTVIVEPIA
jgi:hypothetical protein